MDVERIIRLPEVQKRLGLSRTTIYGQVRGGLLPRPVSLGARAVGWSESAIGSVVAARVRGESDEQIKQLVSELELGRRGSR